MPTPKDRETEDQYVSRCIQVVLDEGTAKDASQAAAICHSMYSQSKKAEENGEFITADELKARARIEEASQEKKRTIKPLDEKNPHLGFMGEAIAGSAELPELRGVETERWRVNPSEHSGVIAGGYENPKEIVLPDELRGVGAYVAEPKVQALAEPQKQPGPPPVGEEPLPENLKGSRFWAGGVGKGPKLRQP